MNTTSKRITKITEAALAAFLFAAFALCGLLQAQTDIVISPTFTPDTANNNAKQVTVNDGGVTNMTGAATWTGPRVGPSESYLYWVMENYGTGGYITGLNFDYATLKSVSNTAQGNTVPVTDAGGMTVGVRVYVAGQERILSQTTPYLYFYTPSTSDPLYNASIALVENGTLNYAVTDGSLGIGAVRQTSYLTARASAGNTAVINLTTKNVLRGDRSSATTLAAVNASTTYTGTAFTYSGTFTDSYGTEHNVTNLQEYNDYLAYLAANLTTLADFNANYENNVKLALTGTAWSATFKPSGTHTISPADPLFWANDGVRGLVADGAGSTVRVAQGGGISVPASMGIAMLVYNSGTGINDGTLIGGWSSQTVNVQGGGKFINNGRIVYSSQTAAEVNWTRITSNSGNWDDPIGTDQAIGAGTVFTNNGVMDVFAFSTDYRNLENNMLNIGGGATFINNGAVNVGVNNIIGASTINGVNMTSTGTVHNTADGVMYMGRVGSLDVASDSIDRGGADVLINGGGLIRVWNDIPNATVINDGQLILGSKVQGGAAIRVYGSGGTGIVNVENKSLIQIKGALAGATTQNVGIDVQGAYPNGSFINSGTINLEGTNAAALRASGGATVTSSGVINIISDIAPSYGLYNYGMWIEGAGSKGILTGEVNMNGKGAIGLYAKGGASINIGGAGAVNFLGGEKQIGFYVHGVGSSIATNSNNMTIDAKDSTLFRIADGALFDGGTYTLNIGGENSNALFLTGLATTATTGAMTMNLTGTNATGLIVEGGATATISDNTTITQSGEGSIAGIADGQKHDLAGQVVSTSNVTKLTAGATLTSALDNVTGYIARNTATVENTGNITFTGSNATGLRVEEGATGSNTGNITVTDGGVAIVAEAATLATQITNTGTLTLNGGSLDNRTTGIRASGPATVADMTAGEIHMNGVGAIGVEAINGATVNLDATALPIFGASDQIAFRLSGAGSKITSNAAAGTPFVASETRSTIFSVENGAVMTGTLNIQATGTAARALVASGQGAQVTVKNGSHFDAFGDNAWAIFANGGANVVVENGVTFDTTGNNAQAIVVDGNAYDAHGAVTGTNKGTVLTNYAQLTPSKNNETILIVRNSGTIINAATGTVTSAATGVTGVLVENASLINNGAIDINNGIAVDVTGAQSAVTNNSGTLISRDGAATIRVGNAAKLNLVGTGNGVIEAQGAAHGVLLSAGAAGLNVNGATINVTAPGATGNAIENAANVAGIQLLNTKINVTDGYGVRTAATLATLNSGTINVTGGGAGILFAQAGGGAMTGNIDMGSSSALTINATGANARGMVLNTSGSVNTAVNINVSAAGASAIVVQNTPTAVVQSGTLVSQSTAAVVDAAKAASFENRGVITPASATGTAVAFDTTVNSAFINSGTINGVVAMNNGANTVTLNASSTVATVKAGSGNDTFTTKGNQAFGTLSGGTGTDRLVFDGAQHTMTAATEIAGFEKIEVTNSSLLTLRTDLVMGDTAGEIGEVAIASTGTVAVRTLAAGNFLFKNKLTGNGTLDVALSAADNAFNFAPTVQNAFAGKVRLGASTFTLGGNNATALNAATLEILGGNHTTVVTGTHTLGGLTINGGRIDFTTTIPADAVSPAFLNVGGTITLTSGTVAVNLPVAGAPVASGTQKPLLHQDNGDKVLAQLASSATTVGAPSSVSLINAVDDTAISNPTAININQNSQLVATGTYDYGLVTSNTATNAQGLFIAYKLTKVDILANKTLALDGDTAADSKFDAIIGGSGNLAINATNAITLNAANTYTGTTLVQTGTLIAGVNDALGDTAALVIDSAAAFKLNGKTQSVGALVTATNSELTLDAGFLTIENGGTSSGKLSGSGTLSLAAGTLTVNGANTGLTAKTLIATSATARLNDAAALGTSSTASIAQGGALVLAPVANGTFSSNIEGNGALIKTGSATATISSTNATFTGTTYVQAGTLSATNLGAVGATPIVTSAGGTFELKGITSGTFANLVSGSGALAVTNASIAISSSNSMTAANLKSATVTMLNNNALGSGAAANIVTLDAGSKINIKTAAAKLGTVNLNGGALAFANDGVFRTGTVAALGNSAGTLVFNVDFNGANGLVAPGTKSDYLKIGNDGSGTHLVHVNYTGVPPPDEASFELIDAGTATAKFLLDAPDGRIDFELSSYELLKGDGTNLMLKSSSWYLTDIGLSRAADAILNTASLQGVDWAYSLDSLYLRMGEIRAENLSGDTAASSTGNVWLRTRGYRLNATNQLSGMGYKQYGYGITAGADKTFAAENGVNLLGGFVDMGSIDRDFDNNGNGDTNSLGVGIYLTLLRGNGWFADFIAKAERAKQRFDAVAVDKKVTSGRYTTQTQGLSAEFGRRFQRRDGWWLEPAAQISVAWINGAKYTTTPKPRTLDVTINDIMSFQYRAQIRFGKEIAGTKWHPYGKFGLAKVDTDGGEITVRNKRFTPDYDGNRAEFGFGTSYRIDEVSQVYFDYEYARAAAYERPWSINLGYRRLW